MTESLLRNWPDRRKVVVDLYSGIERRMPEPTAAQIAESERRAERRFAEVPVPLTNFGAL